jgi:N-acetyl-anhydromuramyl-L-alanine amidase AmpD
MAIKNLPKYKDMRGKLPRRKSYLNVSISLKDWLVIHHSATLTGSAEAFNTYHLINNGWDGGIAYHFVIEKDGTIKQCQDLNARSYHVGNSNTRAIGICLVGDFRKGYQVPTDEQKMSLFLLTAEIKQEVSSINRVLSHQECPGYNWKNCPGDNWNFQEVIKGNDPAITPIVSPVCVPTPLPVVAPVPSMYIIQEGDTFWSISRTLKSTVNDLQKANPTLKSTELTIGSRVVIPAAPVKVKEAPVVSPKPAPKPVVKPKPVVAPKPVPQVKYPLSDVVLKLGSKGEDVKNLQRALCAVYFKCEIDGHYGTGTKNAVSRFQKVHLPYEVDGVFGPKTKKILAGRVPK